MKTIIPISPISGMRTSGIISSRPTAESLNLSVQVPPEGIPEGGEEEKKESEAEETVPTLSSPAFVHPVAQLPTGKPAKECDYDANPSELYLSIQSKRWPDTISRSASHSEEAETWVSRKEKDGKLRWRLLPLHAAIIFKAPEKAVESLLCAFPQGAQCKDDQGMLPIHLAFRNGSSEGVVNLLLVAYPQSIEVKDRKGRIPLTLAQASTSGNREAFIRAIERGPSYYAVAAAATERSPFTIAQRDQYEEKISSMEKEYEEKLAEAEKEIEKLKVDGEERIANLHAEMGKNQETSEVLVDHVNSLQAQITTKADTERFLATKIAKLDSSLREMTATKEKLEKDLTVKNRLLEEENETLRESLEEKEKQREEIKSRALFFEETSQKEKEMTLAEKRKHDESVRTLEVELDALRTTHNMVQAQMKKKAETEQTLASQVSELASKLADSAAQNAEASRQHLEITTRLEDDKVELEKTVEDLMAKLKTVSEALDLMATEQERVVEAAKRHEETMAIAAEAQRQIVANTARQEVVIAEATREREQIVGILQRQAEEVEKTTKERRLILEAVQRQHGEMERANKERIEILGTIAKQKKSMKEIKRTQLAGLPGINADESDDEVSVDDREVGDVSEDKDDEYDTDDEETGGTGEVEEFPFPKVSLTLTDTSSVCSADEDVNAGMPDAELAAVDEKVRLALEAHSQSEEELAQDDEKDVTDEVVADEVVADESPDAMVETSNSGTEEDSAAATAATANTTVVIGATDEATDDSMEVVGSVN